MSVVTKRSTSWYNPLYIPGVKTELGKIVFHDGEKEVLVIPRGYIEQDCYSNADINIELDNIRRANKINFSKEDNFYMSYKEAGYSNDKRTVLYILCNNPKTNIKVNKLEDVLSFSNDSGDHYKVMYSIDNISKENANIKVCAAMYTKPNKKSIAIKTILEKCSLEDNYNNIKVITTLLDKDLIKL